MDGCLESVDRVWGSSLDVGLSCFVFFFLSSDSSGLLSASCFSGKPGNCESQLAAPYVHVIASCMMVALGG